MNSSSNIQDHEKCLRGNWDNPSVCQLKTAYQRINIYKNIKKQFLTKPPLRIFEFGPGLGCLIDLAHTAWPQTEYHVADMDSHLLTALTDRFPFIRPHHIAAIDDLENPEGVFDVIAAVDVWEHLPLPIARAYTKWCWQRLAPGGIMILQTPNWGCPVTPATFYGDLTHCTSYNEKSIRQLFQDAGIPDEAVTVIPRKTPGMAGFFRDQLNTIFGWAYRLVFIFFGAVRIKIFSPDLVAIVRKIQNNPTPMATSTMQVRD